MEEKKKRVEEFPELKYLREHQQKMETDPEYRRETEEFLKALGGWPHSKEE